MLLCRIRDGCVHGLSGLIELYKFTGKVDKVTIDVKEMKTAQKAAENKLRAEAANKKALSY